MAVKKGLFSIILILILSFTCSRLAAEDDISFSIYQSTLEDLPPGIEKRLREYEEYKNYTEEKRIYGKIVSLSGEQDKKFYIILVSPGGSGSGTMNIYNEQGEVIGSITGTRVHIKTTSVNNYRVIVTESSLSYKEGIITVYVFENTGYKNIASIIVPYINEEKENGNGK
jgi:hypothetical protein